ncbi:hypothetical protein OPQ81_010289 [Rhizoctonia solani]|nr:hypothetical protein OPQ81_010289 [Rhizoctonia solani]
MDSRPTRTTARSAQNVNLPQSRPVSMAFSIIEHHLSSTNNQGDPNLSRRSTIISEDAQSPTVEIDPEFAYPDGNIELRIRASPHIFRVHEFQLAKFMKFAELIRQARQPGELTADPERRVKVEIPRIGKLRSKDIRYTLRVIYSSFVSGCTPPRFDSVTLVSTLRVATLYQNPDLRGFAISQLQSRFALSPIYRIALSDELSIPDWETPAFIEICRRPEPLSQREASILGIARTVEVARLREAEQLHQYLGLVHQATTDPFLSADGAVKKDKLQAAGEQTLKHSSLPVCDCRAQSDRNQNDRAFMRTRLGTTGVNHSLRNSSLYSSSAQNSASGSLSVIPCQIHQLAPPIASESRTLFKHLSSTLGRLATLKQKVDTKMRGLQGSVKEFSVENEIMQASWVRKAQ